MRHEKILKRKDGTRVKIYISVSLSFDGIVYRSDVRICEKGKRTWKPVTDSDSYSYRKLSMRDREIKDLENQLTMISGDELLEAKLEAWQRLKPANF